MNSFVFFVDRDTNASVKGIEEATSGTTVVEELSVAEMRRVQVQHAGDIVHEVDHFEGDAASFSRSAMRIVCHEAEAVEHHFPLLE